MRLLYFILLVYHSASLSLFLDGVPIVMREKLFKLPFLTFRLRLIKIDFFVCLFLFQLVMFRVRVKVRVKITISISIRVRG
jgi:hypothetical protein